MPDKIQIFKKLRNILITMLNNTWVLFKPRYWIMNDPVSKEWDSELNQLLDNHSFSFVSYRSDPDEIDTYNIMLGTNRLWIRNHPYASFVHTSMGRRAKRSTILKAEHKIKKELGLDLYKSNDNSEYVIKCHNKLHKNNE